MNATQTSRHGSWLQGSLALACSQVLAGFCALEAALPRAGRAAAALLLRRESAVLRAFERAGAAVQGIAANPILFSAFAVCAAATVGALAERRPLRAAASAATLAAAGWFYARSGRIDAAALWWPVIGAIGIAAASIFVQSRSASALGAIALQCGLGAFAGWALLVGRGAPAIPALDRASEALVLGGIAVAGLGAWRRRSPWRTWTAAAALLAVVGAAAAAPDATHAVIRHLVAAGASGLPLAVTVGLFAAALAGLVLATGAAGLAVPLLIALVCARRPEPWFIAGALASSALLLSRAWESRPAARR